MIPSRIGLYWEYWVLGYTGYVVGRWTSENDVIIIMMMVMMIMIIIVTSIV